MINTRYATVSALAILSVLSAPSLSLAASFDSNDLHNMECFATDAECLYTPQAVATDLRFQVGAVSRFINYAESLSLPELLNASLAGKFAKSTLSDIVAGLAQPLNMEESQVTALTAHMTMPYAMTANRSAIIDVFGNDTSRWPVAVKNVYSISYDGTLTRSFYTTKSDGSLAFDHVVARHFAFLALNLAQEKNISKIVELAHNPSLFNGTMSLDSVLAPEYLKNEPAFQIAPLAGPLLSLGMLNPALLTRAQDDAVAYNRTQDALQNPALTAVYPEYRWDRYPYPAMTLAVEYEGEYQISSKNDSHSAETAIKNIIKSYSNGASLTLPNFDKALRALVNSDELQDYYAAQFNTTTLWTALPNNTAPDAVAGAAAEYYAAEYNISVETARALHTAVTLQPSLTTSSILSDVINAPNRTVARNSATWKTLLGVVNTQANANLGADPVFAAYNSSRVGYLLFNPLLPTIDPSSFNSPSLQNVLVGLEELASNGTLSSLYVYPYLQSLSIDIYAFALGKGSNDTSSASSVVTTLKSFINNSELGTKILNYLSKKI